MNNFTQNIFTSSRNSFKKMVALCGFLLMSVLSFGQITMTSTGSYTQNFDSFSPTASTTWANNSTFSSWYSSLGGTIAVNTGTTATAAHYNYGSTSASDRALGSINSNATGVIAYGVQFLNNSTVSISDMTLGYTGEQWRNNGNTNVDQLNLYYRVSSSPITSIDNSPAGWTQVNSLIFNSLINTNTAAALNGNLTANRTVINPVSIPSLNVPSGSYIVFKWLDSNISGNDHGLAIDDLTVNWTIVTSVAPTVTTTAVSNITTSTADSGGDVTSDGGAALTARGVAFGTSANPITGISDGTDTGIFTSNLTGLSPNTQYFYRAFATNSVNTSYGAELSFYTLANTPGVLNVANAQVSTLDITVNSTTQNSNSVPTEYAIHETTTNQFVQADGTLGATAVWQTENAWSTITITGLTQNTTYTFETKARNQELLETVYSNTTSGTTLADQTTDWSILQSPTSQIITEGTTFNVYSQAYKVGLTEAAGQAPGLSAWVGYSSSNSNPNGTGWTWVSASFNSQIGNNDEFVGSLGLGLTSGTYYYASRFQIGSGSFTYGGTNGIWNNDNAVLTVNVDLVDYCNVSPSGINNSEEGTLYSLYSDVYEPGITPGAGQGAGITAFIGYSSTNNDPSVSSGWTWVAATYNSESGNNDVYKIDLPSNLALGTYYFASRYQKSGSSEFRYGGTNGLWNNDNGVLNVVSNLVDYCNIQFPLSGSITQGDAYTVYAQVYEPGITPGSGQGAGITAQVGYSTLNSTPDNTWTWLTTTYQTTETGNNDEYFVDLSTGLAPGTYYYASRFQKTGSTQFQYGGTNGIWNNDNGVLTVNQATPVVTAGSPSGSVGAVFNYTILATNSPTSYAVVSGTLPLGLTLDTTTGVISGTPTSVSITSVDVTATNSGGTSTAATLNFSISQGNQTIAFGSLAPKVIDDASFTLNATASSGLTVTYASSNTSVASVSGNTVTIVGAGSTIITASQAGDSNYFAANDVNQTLIVNYPVILAWDFTGVGTTTNTTLASTTLDSGLIATSITRGTGATWSSAANSWRTTGFQNNGISTANTDYFQITIQASSGKTVSLSTIDANFAGTNTFAASPGVSSQFAYSLDGTTFNLIGSPSITIGTPVSLPQIDISGVTALQNVPSGTTITLRYYASGQTTTGGWGFNSPSAGTNGLAISGVTSVVSTTWNGTSWTNGLPNASLEAIIDATYNTNVGGIQGPFTAKKLTVTTNGNLTINSETNITVQNDVINNGALTVESNANLVQVNNVANTGNITVKRNTNPLMRFDYVMWSSPVDGTQKLFDFSPLTSVSPTIRFYNYDSANNVYTSVLSPSTTEFVNATGYLIRLPFNHPTAPVAWTGTFSGVPNNGPISLESLTSGLYYATGNPYPSTIDADDFILTNGLTDALYFWRKTNGASGSAYATYTLAGGTAPSPGTLASPSSAIPNGTIQVGQGFIAKAFSTTLAFDNTMRSTPNNDNQTFKSASSELPSTVERNRFWLNLSDATQTIGQTMVSYMTGATNGLDAQIDGKYINDSATALTSLIEGQEFAVQGKTLPFTASDVVPLGFKTETAGNYSISIFDKDGLFANNGQIIYLRDNLLNSVQNLNSGAYNFTSQAGVFNGRFDVIYQNALSTDVVDFTSNNVSIYNQNNVLNINSGNNTMSTVKVYDVLGRLLAQSNQVNASQTQIKVPATNQTLIVQITSSEGIVVVKKVAN